MLAHSFGAARFLGTGAATEVGGTSDEAGVVVVASSPAVRSS